jgi:hypothetical protein
LISSESAAELYDPTANAFSLTASMIGDPNYKPTAIGGRTATLLLNGNVLVTGGAPSFFDTSGFESFSAAEIYDSRAGAFTATGNMTTGRFSHAAALLPDGTVLVTGGRFDGRTDEVNTTGELYNPGTGAFFAAGDMVSGRVGHQATLLNDGRVLITGGSKNAQVLDSAEIYTPPVLVSPPVLLSLSGDGRGQGAILHAGTPEVVSASNPAVVGEALEIYLTGLADSSAIPPQVAIGGRMAEVLFFGQAPGFVGLNQVNVRVPSRVTPGESVPVRITYIGRSSNAVTIVVR